MRILIVSFAALLITAMSAFTAGNSLVVTSAAFTDNGMIPVKYTCTGQQASPPLTVTNIPANAKSLALIVHDPDAPMEGGFTHWVVWNIDTKGSIPENFKSKNEGLNGRKQKGYIGMCPPKGTHHYYFWVYALDVKLNIDQNTDKAALEKAMNGHILATGVLVGLYDKSNK